MKIYKISEVSEDAKKRLEQQNYQLIEQKSINGYDIALVYLPMIDIYQIGLQKEGMDFTDVPSQMVKSPQILQDFKKTMYEIKRVIDAWLWEYGKLHIISANEDRQDRFKRILEKMGYEVSEETLYGKRSFYIGRDLA